MLIGADPMNTEAIWDLVFHHQIQTHGAGTAAVIALSGIDIALWDLRGKLLNQPVYRLLGGRQRRIRAYAGGLSLGYKPLNELEKEVHHIVQKGYKAIKLRVGQGPKEDAKRVTHIRKTFGDDLDIALDAQTRYHVTDILDVVSYCEDNHVYWLEEPFTPDNIHAYQAIKRQTPIPIAAGENHYTKHAFRDLLQAGAIDILQADCTKEVDQTQHFITVTRKERTECEGNGFSSGLQPRGISPKRISNCNDLWVSNRNTDSNCSPLMSRSAG